jgi:cell division protein FtsB
MLTWFKSLSLTWKIILGVAILIAAFLIYDWITGGISDLKGYIFDKESAARMAQVEQLTQENAVLRAQKDEAEKQAVESKAKEAVFESRNKDLDAKTRADLEKTNLALQQQAQEEAVTAQPIDNYTRCERTKQKMLDLNIPAAKEMNCNESKQ